MRKSLTLLLIIFVAVSCKNSATSYAEEKKEVQTFMENYMALLQNAKFDSVALLYADTGVIATGNGSMAIQNMDTTKAIYSRYPKIKNDFRWENTRIDILNNDAALVNSTFYWHDKNSPDTIKYSYTGVLLKKDKNWKIINEHESIDIATLAKLIKKSDQKK